MVETSDGGKDAESGDGGGFGAAACAGVAGANTRRLRGLWSQVLNNRRLVRAAQTMLNRAHGTADLDVGECNTDNSSGADRNCGSMTTVMAWPGGRLLTWWSRA